MAAAEVFVCNPAELGREREKSRLLPVGKPSQIEPLEENVKLQESCSELHRSLMTVTCGLTPHYFGTSGYWHWCLCWTWTPLVPSEPYITTCPPQFLLTRSQCAADGMIKSCLSICCTTSFPEQREVGGSCSVPGCGCWCQRWHRENSPCGQPPDLHCEAWPQFGNN